MALEVALGLALVFVAAAGVYQWRAAVRRARLAELRLRKLQQLLHPTGTGPTTLKESATEETQLGSWIAWLGSPKDEAEEKTPRPVASEYQSAGVEKVRGGYAGDIDTVGLTKDAVPLAALRNVHPKPNHRPHNRRLANGTVLSEFLLDAEEAEAYANRKKASQARRRFSYPGGPYSSIRPVSSLYPSSTLPTILEHHSPSSALH